MDIKTILQNYKQGSSKDYDAFVSELSDPLLQGSVLTSYMHSLKECIADLGKDFEILIGVILKINWASQDANAVKAYQSFVLNLVSAHTFYLKACLRMIIKQFSPKIDKPPPGEKTVVPDSKKVEDEKCFLNLHMLLRAIVQIVPLTPTILFPLLAENFPFMNKDVYIQASYVRNLLQITAYLPTHRSKVLELIVDRMTRLDVRAPRNEIEDAEDDKSDDEEEGMDQDVIFEMDELDQSLAEPTLVNRQMSAEIDGGPMSHQEADRLDVMMELVFKYIDDICRPEGKLDWEATKKLYKDFLLVFERIILPTHACCHVQFIMFYICSFKEELLEGFLDYLLKKVQDPNCQGVFRQAAVAYVASFLARATYIPVNTIKTCLDLIVSWVHRYILQAAESSNKADVTHHGPFFSVCQAVFYIFTFRHKDILNSPKGHKYAQSLNLQTIVTCKLNPLRVCLPVVAKTFASVTRMHQLAFCDTIIEKNKRSMLPVAGERSAMVTRLTQVNPLDSFFPFDPYLLSRSGKYIVGIYKEYEGTPVQEPNESDVEEEETYDDMEGNSSQEEGIFGLTPTAYGKTPTSPTDFLMYGISPGYKHV